MDTESRWKQRLKNLNNVFKHFESACARNYYDELELAGLVKLYELVFELCWKTLKDYLYEEGIDTKTPRETIKKAYQYTLLENVDQWLDALESRNQFAHIYDEKTANDAVPKIKEILFPMIRACVEKLNEKVTENE